MLCDTGGRYHTLAAADGGTTTVGPFRELLPAASSTGLYRVHLPGYLVERARETMAHTQQVTRHKHNIVAKRSHLSSDPTPAYFNMAFPASP